ncbi:MAG TPA: serine/threonine-protein kinase, partial [Chroococcales cyanobacterium]
MVNQRDSSETSLKQGSDSASGRSETTSSPASSQAPESSGSPEISQRSEPAGWAESSSSGQANYLSDGILAQRYQIIGRLGQGGMSIVYKARDLTMNRVVAIKCLQPHLIANPQNLRRFQQEARAAGNLTHDNLVRVYDCDVDENGVAYLIMEFLDGKSLADLIQEEGKLKPERTIEIFIQIARGLAHAHEYGIIHRDLKPSNIMLLEDKRGFDVAKVVDFGIAKLTTDGDTGAGTVQSLTQTGEIFGSPLYMSPEQCSGQTLDRRSDIYSLGCLMYETLTGQAPFMGANVLDTMHRHQTEEPKPLVEDDARDTLIKRLNSVVLRCLKKDPADRYATMDDLVTHLEKCALGSETSWKFYRFGSGRFRLRGKSKSNKKGSLPAKLIPVLIGVMVLSLSALFLASLFSCLSVIRQPSAYHTEEAKLWPMVMTRKMEEPVTGSDYVAKKLNLRQVLSESKNHFRQSPLPIVSAKEQLGMLEYATHHWTEAREQFEDMMRDYDLLGMKVAPKRGEVLCLIGFCYYWTGNEEKAQETFQKAINYFNANRISYYSQAPSECLLYCETGSRNVQPLTCLVDYDE